MFYNLKKVEQMSIIFMWRYSKCSCF